MRLVGISSCVIGSVILLWTLSALLSPPPDSLPPGFHLLGLALELPASPDEVGRINPQLKDQVKNGLWADSFLVVPVYVLLFVAQGVLLRRNGWNVIGIGVIVCAVLAGLADEIENSRQVVLLQANHPTDPQVLHVYIAASFKWALLGVVMLLLGTAAWERDGWWKLASSVSFSSAALLLMGIGVHRPLVQYGFTLMGLALVAVGVLECLGPQ